MTILGLLGADYIPLCSSLFPTWRFIIDYLASLAQRDKAQVLLCVADYNNTCTSSFLMGHVYNIRNQVGLELSVQLYGRICIVPWFRIYLLKIFLSFKKVIHLWLIFYIYFLLKKVK